MYHKVDIIAPTTWWVTRAAFERQMDAIAGRRVVSLADYSPGSNDQCVITFDDAYENVHRHAFPILRERGYPFEIFVNSDLVGRWTHFDPYEPLTRICGVDRLLEMASFNARIQWHARSHRNLTTLDTEAVDIELSVPEELRGLFAGEHFRWLAYPFGAHSPEIVDAARGRYDGALSVCDGSPDDRHQLNRIVVTEATELSL